MAEVSSYSTGLYLVNIEHNIYLIISILYLRIKEHLCLLKHVAWVVQIFNYNHPEVVEQLPPPP